MDLKKRFFGNVRGDILGGITAGIVAMPLALGFGVASGLENGAAAGMYGAIAVGLMAALFGGTASQISGPTGPMTVVVAGIAATLTGDPKWVFAMVVLAGLLQVALGVMRLGRYINYIPYPVISGFMSGIGVIIIILQMAPLIGQKSASNTVDAILHVADDLGQLNPAALGLGLATIALIYGVPRITRAAPSTLVALILVTLASVLIPMDVPRIGSIPRGLPSLSLPDFEMAKFMLIVTPAIMLAVVGSLDSLLTSLVADAVTKTRHDSEQELVGQGIGNVLAGLIGGLPGAGATMRTVVNVRSGGRGHLSGVVHAILLIAILLILGPLAEQIPMAVLAGILITVGIGIVDVKGLKHTLHAPRGDAGVMLLVLGLTVFVDLMRAVMAGMVMAAMILLKRLSDLDPATHSPLSELSEHDDWLPALNASDKVLGEIYVVELHGSLFFGNAGPLQRKLEGMADDARAVILHMGDVRYLDQSGVYVLADLVSDLHKAKKSVFIAEMHEEPADIMKRLGAAPGTISPEHIFDSLKDAITNATQELHPSQPPTNH